jgi:hypothetical protein
MFGHGETLDYNSISIDFADHALSPPTRLRQSRAGRHGEQTTGDALAASVLIELDLYSFV